METLTKEVAEFANFIPAIQAQLEEVTGARGTSNRHDDVIAELLNSHNKLVTNARQSMAAYEDISSRVVPGFLARTVRMEGELKRLTSVVETLTTPTMPAAITPVAAAAVPAAAAVVPAPAAVVPALAAAAVPAAAHSGDEDLGSDFQDMVDMYYAMKRKRARDDDAAARNVRMRTDAVAAAPPTVAPTIPPVAPIAAAPVVLAPAPPAQPTRPPPMHAAPPRAPASAPAPALPSRAPRAPAIVQRPDPACEVVFGPVNWNKTHSGSPNVKQDILGLIGVVLPTAAHLTFTTRRYGKHEAYTLVAFATPEIATWVVDNWARAHRDEYPDIYAEHPNF
ncbi:hypothetical protein K438DRAFT_1848833 [Mycena galopus ATCC 62051]|nr:hypothetical protein K438DRAFT_1848833 [Mycena galopus ATCC 62051]